MRIQTLHDHDPRECAEDGWFVSLDGTLAEVTDGCSEPHCRPNHPPFMYDLSCMGLGQMTGGQMISEIVNRTFATFDRTKSLQQIFLRANQYVWGIQNEYRREAVSQDDAGTLADASFSCVKLEKDGFWHGLWGADVFTLWETMDGEIGIAGGDNRESDLAREQLLHDTVANAKDRQSGLEEYFLVHGPRLKKEQENVLFACINGQPKIQNAWREFIMPQNTKTIILLSDGAWIPLERWHQNQQMAEEFFDEFKKGGLHRALAFVRSTQNEGLTSQRVKRPEATIVAISMD